jgi:Ca2+-transporting ATPase
VTERRLRSFGDDAHVTEASDLLVALDSTPEGLSSAQAAERIEEYGPNALPEGKGRTLGAMILDQFKDFLIGLLIVAALISGLLGEAADTIAILVIIVLNAVMGVVQEYRAEKAMEALRKMAAITATVRRDDEVVEIPADQLVLGDVVLLDAGRSVPADMRLLEAAQLRAGEAALTGESVPVDKDTESLAKGDVPIGDRTDMVYRGTQIVAGRGVGVVTAIGTDTELGRIATLLDESEDTKTPLQRRLGEFGKHLTYAAVALVVLVFVVGLLRGEDVLVMFLTAVSLAVAAVPEALPAVATVTLAIGARRLVKTHALVRRLPAVETLGSTTFICTDKTGTLTLNRMTVERVAVGGESADALPDSIPAEASPWVWMAQGMALSNDVEGSPGSELVGDPTEIALVEAVDASVLDRVELTAALPRAAEVPFDSDRKLMTTVHAHDGRFVSFTKGAAEQVLERSRDMLGADGKPVPIQSRPILDTVERWSEKGLRVLAFGMRRLDSVAGVEDSDELESGLTFIGLVGLVDPPRPEAAEAVRTCKHAGIVPVMITGDHPATALAIARRLGIAECEDELLTGSRLDELSLEMFERHVEEIRVYARVAPEQKLKIVQALQDKGEFVGMTGDGVNDAPALATADIGIAMGVTGTDVAKEASDMILTDDDFSSIVKSVREGRRIFDNIRKFIKYTMSSNSGEIWTILLAPIFGLPIPLLPIHILWINLVTDGLPGLALAAEPQEKGIMERPPRAPKESIFSGGLGYFIVWVGLAMGAAALVTQAAAIRIGDTPWQTMVFTVLCFAQMGNALAVRSEQESLFSLGLLSNTPLLGAVMLTVLLQLLIIYVPFLQPIFRTEALSIGELATAVVVSSSVFWLVEIEKWVKRRRGDLAKGSQPSARVDAA